MRFSLKILPNLTVMHVLHKLCMSQCMLAMYAYVCLFMPMYAHLYLYMPIYAYICLFMPIYMPFVCLLYAYLCLYLPMFASEVENIGYVKIV